MIFHKMIDIIINIILLVHRITIKVHYRLNKCKIALLIIIVLLVKQVITKIIINKVVMY